MPDPSNLPLSLYIHLPWCVRKCPYCDFNSHQSGDAELPEQQYLRALVADLDRELAFINENGASGNRPGEALHSIFIGGGTPSLMSASFYQQLFVEIDKRLNVVADTEITMEANPGTLEQANFSGFREAGVNRLSIGVQSFNDRALLELGRIHDAETAVQAYHAARTAGFDNINLDLMHGLPGQRVEEALADLRQAIALAPEHISWYQLTIEQNTAFYKRPPLLPDEDMLWSIYQQGSELLESAGYQRYEVSAYAQPGKRSQHNLNYWQFGDYLGIGAGAHGKLTTPKTIVRRQKTRVPADYMSAEEPLAASSSIDANELALEFMLNALRLAQGFELELFAQRTGMPASAIASQLAELAERNLLDAKALQQGRVQPAARGQLFVDDMVSVFMD